MDSPHSVNPFMAATVLIKDIQGKIIEALDCQANSFLLTWGCALIALELPADDTDWQTSLLDATMTSVPAPVVQGDLALELPPLPAVPEPEWLLAPEDPDPPTEESDSAPHGFMLVTYGGEAFWLTPTHLKALVEAGPLVYGRVDFYATLGFRSSPSAHTPVVDMNVEVCAKPGVSVSGKRPQYGWSQYVHAKRHHQDLVLLTSGKPEGFPW